MARLSGKVALVTGASRGIGAAIARRLAADGAAVIVNYARNSTAANDLVRQIKSTGGNATAIQADVSDPAQVRSLFDNARKIHGHIDILVNNAGVWQQAPLAEFTVKHYQEVFATNVQGPIVTAAESLKHFPPTGGRIINISSVASRGPMPANSVYAASKAALETFTLNWASELGARKITVNTVSPGFTETDMSSVAPAEFKKALAEKTPLGRVGLPEDIADVVAFLASEEARWITGENLGVSGGLLP